MSVGNSGPAATRQGVPTRLSHYLLRCVGGIAYVLALGLVLRLCARTYPGLYIRSSAFLNAILNGDLFGGGYLIAITAGLVHILQLTTIQVSSGRVRLGWLTPVRYALIAVCICLAVFGLYIAFMLARLPGMDAA